MAYTGNKNLARLDRLAIAVLGINAENGTAPRLSILANLVFLATGIVGLVLCAQGQFGSGLVFGAMFAASTHTVIVEHRKRGNAQLDERERAIFWKSMAIGAFVPCVLVASWTGLLAPFAELGMWYPDRPDEWQAVAFFILGLLSQITNIATAWLTPAYAAELDDED